MSKKKYCIISLLLSFCLVFSCVASVIATESDIDATYLKLFINNDEIIFRTPISVSENDIIVPLREMTELFGWKYELWEEDEIAICTFGTRKIAVQNGRSAGKIDSDMVEMTTAPYMMESEIFVPLSFLAEGLDLTYYFDEDANAAYVNQNPKITPHYITNQIYVSKSAGGVYTASFNESAAYYALNTRSSAATGEMFYEIDISEVPDNFATAKLVIPSSRITVTGTYYVHKVTSGLDGANFGTLNFATESKITMKDTDKLPLYEEEPFATVASSLTASIDMTQYVKDAKANGETMLRIYLDYHTWETKAQADGSRVKSKGTTLANPHLEISQDPEWVKLPDTSNIKIAYQQKTAKTSERVAFQNGKKISVIKDSANSGRNLNTLISRGIKNSEITYTFPIDIKGEVRGANLTLFGRATQDGIITITDKNSGKTLTISVKEGSEYKNININVRELIDPTRSSATITLGYVPENGWGEVYIYGIKSKHAPEIGITTQTVIEN